MKKRKGISTFSAQVTSTVSVALVLLLLGIVATLGIAARSVSKAIKENMGFDVVMVDGVPDKYVNTVKQLLTSSDYVSSFEFFSAEDAMRQWKDDTGEDVMEIFGVNPFAPEFNVKVKADYACMDSLNHIIATMEKLKGVREVPMHASLVESVDRNIRTLMLVLSVAAIALTLISFVLINNTVRLAIYAKRFLIHTMKLVGAAPSFIRKPFLVSNAISGVAAAALAVVMLCALVYYYTMVAGPEGARMVNWGDIALVAVMMFVAGVAICT
ncbi:MAG: permease-like cell division protein FtsX, partial [Muribaculaceae bacterium]|nr:permease-like cell division protein FtsX [Muribaculaceae bacterium]